MHSSITVKFVDFWKGFNATDNKFIDALKAKRNVYVLPEDSQEKPDLLFYSRCGLGKHYLYDNCVKIYYTGENDYPNFNECDYAISFHDIDLGKRNIRYPLFLLNEYNFGGVKTHQNINSELYNRDFCSIVISNVANCDPFRLKIIDAVDSYKPLAYGGSYRNNSGGKVVDKVTFISKFKFNLALENSLLDGYVTEKIIEPISAHTVPIYFGGNKVKLDFNPESFIHVTDYNNLDSLVRDIARIDNDPQLYLSMLTAPQFLSDRETDYDNRLSEFLNDIADNPKIFRPQYGEIGLYATRYRIVHPLSQRRIYLRLSKLIGKVLQPTYFKQLH